ncbi:MAG: hypothetical protein ACREAG_07630 [Nitrosopumilaceae archaeon]
MNTLDNLKPDVYSSIPLEAMESVETLLLVIVGFIIGSALAKLLER